MLRIGAEQAHFLAANLLLLSAIRLLTRSGQRSLCATPCRRERAWRLALGFQLLDRSS